LYRAEGVELQWVQGEVEVELRCATASTAKGGLIQTLANDLAWQVAANPQVIAVSKLDIPMEELKAILQEESRRHATSWMQTKSRYRYNLSQRFHSIC